jgi:hypothetical protein
VWLPSALPSTTLSERLNISATVFLLASLVLPVNLLLNPHQARAHKWAHHNCEPCSAIPTSRRSETSSEQTRLHYSPFSLKSARHRPNSTTYTMQYAAYRATP